MNASAVPDNRRCHAKSKQSGERCGKRSVPGASVCRTHGGAAPQVQRAAAMRLAQMVDPAMGVLARELTNQSSRPADRLRAVENILDRAGYPRGAEVTTNETEAKEMLADRLRRMIEQTNSDHENGTRS